MGVLISSPCRSKLSTPRCRAARGERPVDRFDDVAALAEPAHGRLEVFGERPHPRLPFPGEPITFQILKAADTQRAIEVGADLAGLSPQVKHPIPGLPEHGAVDAGEPLG